ncbi:MAG: hypothetical protein RJA36_2524 [Pseudomonadota bacterium]|jgi:pimeloyl-ACP methyl ester carboxylesterase
MSTPPRPLVVFSHGNSFPAGTYAVLLRQLRERGLRVEALDRFGHDPRHPVTTNWPHLVQQLFEFAASQARGHAGPLYLVGHSMGGFLSLMCAARHPQIAGRAVDGVVLLDSPLLGGWRARLLEAMQRTRLIGRLSPGKISRKRRHHWPDAQSALEHFHRKRRFAAWDPEVLRDYIAHGTQDELSEQGQRRVLRFEREVETRIYNTLPHNLEQLLRRHPLRCPLAFIGGTDSEEMRQAGLAMTRRLVDSAQAHRLQMLAGSHLFPMERPRETADAIARALRSFLPPEA